MGVELQPGDVILVHGRGWLSSAIRSLTRSPGERPTWVSHCAIAVDEERIVEALPRGVFLRRMPYSGNDVRIYRPLNISRAGLRRIALRAELHVGDAYGYSKLLLHGLDGLLGGVRLFRRLAFVDRWPICSFIVADAYESEGYRFGVPMRAITPDDIADHVTTRVDHYARIHP